MFGENLGYIPLSNFTPSLSIAFMANISSNTIFEAVDAILSKETRERESDAIVFSISFLRLDGHFLYLSVYSRAHFALS